MPKVGSAYVEIKGDNKPLKKDLAESENTVKSSMSRMKGFVGAAAAAMGAALAYGMVRGMNAATQAASNLEEATSKFNVVFKGSAAEASKWSDTLVDSYAMSTRESKEYLASIQDLLVPMGMASDAAGKMSFEVTKLAADLGSFNNRRTEEVMADIQSALVGNYETMKKYGVVLNEAAVKQEALRAGLAKTKDEITAADKAQAAYSLIVRGSTAAIGDMERTADQHANTTKRLNAEWEDFTATLGQKTIGVMTRIKGVTADILDNLTKAMVGPGIDEQIAALEQEYEKLNETVNKSSRQLAIEADEKRRAENAKRMQEDARRTVGALNEIQKAYQDAMFGPPKQEESETPMLRRLREIREELDRLRDLRIDNLLNEAFDLPAAPTANMDKTISDLEKIEKALDSFFGDLDKRYNQVDPFLDYYFGDIDRWEDKIKNVDKALKSFFSDIDNPEIDTFLDYWFEDLDNYGERLKKASNEWLELSQRTAEAMQSNFSDLFYDAITGELDSFSDYFRAFGKSILRAWSDIMGQMAAQSIFGDDFKGGGLLSQLGGWFRNLGGGSGGDFGGFNLNDWLGENARGNIYGPRGLIPFAKGGIVNGPTLFPYTGGTGLMGEAGPEAIMPLRRTPSGKLGVETTGGGSAGDTFAPAFNFQLSAMDSRTGAEYLKAQAPAIAAGIIDQMKHDPSFARFMRGGR